jgi:hypothetical protein
VNKKVEIADGIATASAAIVAAEDTASNMSMWQKVKEKTLQLFGSLIMEKDNETGHWKMSLARVAWWLVFIPALYIWITGKGIIDVGTGNAATDISPNHFNVLLMLTGYNFGKKLNSTVQKWVTTKKSNSSNPSVPIMPDSEEDLGPITDGPV